MESANLHISISQYYYNFVRNDCRLNRHEVKYHIGKIRHDNFTNNRFHLIFFNQLCSI